MNEFPKTDPLTYSFEYDDTATFEEEIDEWFSYNPAEFTRLIRAREAFVQRLHTLYNDTWLNITEGEKRAFVEAQVDELSSVDLRGRCRSLQAILHIILGVWDETAALQVNSSELGGEGKGKSLPVGQAKQNESEETKSSDPRHSPTKTEATESQIAHMKTGILLFAEAGGINLLFEVMQNAFNNLWYAD